MGARARTSLPAKAGWERLLPLLLHVQAGLEDDLSLAVLARIAGLSPSRLHRVFKAIVGETPKGHVARLRLERGVFRMLVQDSTLLDIALACGFRNPETFTRAFRRQFGRTPAEYREWIRQRVPRRALAARAPGAGGGSFALSATKVIRLRESTLAFVRHVGPYEAVPDSLFTRLERWAAIRRIPGPRIWMGIGHDAPGVTPPEKLRFDAALVVPAPFAPEAGIACQSFPGGEYALTTHAGSFETLPAAYAAIFPRALALPRYNLVGLPAVEIYHATRVDARRRLNHTDICLPVARSP